MIGSFALNRNGTASVEFALLLPMLIVLLFGGLEAGHFVWTQHKLVEAVRDGARFASRLQVDHVCSGANSIISSADVSNIKLITRTGQIADTSAHAVVPGWTTSQEIGRASCRERVSSPV